MKYLKGKIAIMIYALTTLCFISFKFEKDVLKVFPSKNVSVTNAFMLLGIVVIFQWIVKHWKNGYGKLFYFFLGILSMIFSFITFMGKYFSSDPEKGLGEILMGNGGVLRAAICFWGGCMLFFFALLGIGSLKAWSRENTKNTEAALQKAERFLFGEHCFIKQCIVLGICWLPHVIIRYPGAMWVDTFNSLGQYYGNMDLTTQHPLVYTYLLGNLTDWGLKLGDGGYGLFVLVLFQTIAMLLILAYCIHTMRRFGVPYWCCTVALIIFCLTPNIISYMTTAVIDAPYGAAFVLLMTEMVYYLYTPEIYKKSWRHLLLTALAVLGTFFRYNGFYVVVIMFVMILCREFFRVVKKKQKIIYSVMILLVLFVPTAAGKMMVKHLNSEHNARYVSDRAKYAMPIQHIARYMVYYGDTDVTPEEMEKIQKVMKWSVEEYKEHYYPYKFDGVKFGYNNNATSEEVKDFLKIWIKLFFRHPKVYIDASIHQNYLLFSPLADNCRYHKDSQEMAVAASKKYDFTEVYVGNANSEFWTNLQQKIWDYYVCFAQFPILGLMVNQGWYTLLLLGICLYALFRKNRKLLFLSMPLLLTLAIAFVGPAVLHHQRYTFPIMYSMPLFYGMFLCGGRNASADWEMVPAESGKCTCEEEEE